MNKPQKIFDIIPPEKIEYPLQKTKAIKPLIEKKVSPNFLKKTLGFIIFFVIVFVLLANFVFVRGEIQIWPETETPNFKEKITIDTKKEDADISAKIIPGKIFEEEKIISQEFPATGKLLKEEKSQGQIRVYNNYSTSPQVLIANTRFISAEGKLFRTLERVTIPGGKEEKGKLQPGFIDIKVIADGAGEEYNIGATTFSIPGFVGTPKYTAFYGKSFQAMQGGFRGEVSRVTKEDLEKAKENLTNRLLEEGRDSFKKKISSEYIIMDDGLSSEIIESDSSRKAGEEAETFTYRIGTKLKTIAFRKTDLENFVREFIYSQFPKDKKLQEESLKIIWKIDSTNFEVGKIVLNLEFSAKVYSGIDETQLKTTLQGKSLTEAKTILSNQAQIIKVQIKTWPFWVKNIPEDSEKIKIRLILD